MWKNKTECGIHATRFIASWLRAGGRLRYGVDYDDLREWLETLKVDGKKLSKEDIDHIVDLAQNGKMELEHSARTFLSERWSRIRK